MTRINTNIPPFVEERILKEENDLNQMLGQFQKPIPTNFLKLETKERNYMCSTTGWKEPTCERYGFLVKGKWEQFDIPHVLLEKLELDKGKEIACLVYLSPLVLDKELVFGAYTIENECEIFLNKPLTINSLSTEITRWLNEIENLKTQITKLVEEKENNLPNLASLIITKSPQEIIIIIKRFEWDKNKEDKKIREYYHLTSTDSLANDRINNYLYRKAIGENMEMNNNSIANKENHWDIYKNYYYIGLFLLFITPLFIIIVKAKKLKKNR